jgi:ribonuclease HI/ribosomal protein S18 acetylase RimI-like enzyme
MIQIQKLSLEQIGETAKLLRSEWLLHAENTRSYSEQKIQDRDVALWLKERVLEKSDFECRIAVEESGIVGFVLFRIQDNIRIAQHEKSVKVEDIYVIERARGRGVAKMLLAVVEEFATRENIKEVLADVYVFNDASKNLFSSQSYSPEYVSYMKLLDSDSCLIPPTGLKNAKLFCDGGSRGNPGPSAGGYVILDQENNVVKSNGKYLGITTNNQAEYHSLKGGLEMAVRLGVRELDVYMDSLLVINQMKGIYKIKNRDLWPIHDAVTKLVSKFQKVNFTHVPRELNRLADEVVNKTLDEELK